jgi:hypothetical protein
MKTGTLFYNMVNERLGIVFRDGSRNDGLPCGMPLQALTNDGWKDTRVEHNGDDWYLPGLFKAGEIPSGLAVRVIF